MAVTIGVRGTGTMYYEFPDGVDAGTYDVSLRVEHVTQKASTARFEAVIHASNHWMSQDVSIDQFHAVAHHTYERTVTMHFYSGPFAKWPPAEGGYRLPAGKLAVEAEAAEGVVWTMTFNPREASAEGDPDDG